VKSEKAPGRLKAVLRTRNRNSERVRGGGRDRRDRRGRRGFSLIETLVAVAIFSIAVVGIIEGLAGSARTQAWIESQSRAVMLAQNIMAETEYVGDLEVGTEGGQFEGEDSRYAWASEILETEFEGLFEVRVTVSWTEGSAARDYQLVTYLRARSKYETTDMGTQGGASMGAPSTGAPSMGSSGGTNAR
jgi:general secretion pathway protein I